MKEDPRISIASTFCSQLWYLDLQYIGDHQVQRLRDHRVSRRDVGIPCMFNMLLQLCLGIRHLLGVSLLGELVFFFQMWSALGTSGRLLFVYGKDVV